MPIPSGNLVTPVGQRNDSTLRSLLIDSKDRLHVVDSLAGFSEGVDFVGSGFLPLSSTVEIAGGVVPMGEIWHIQNASITHTVGSINLAQIRVYSGGNAFIVLTKATSPQYEWLVFNGLITLKGGDEMKGYFSGTTQACNIDFRYFGYKAILSE